MYSPESIAACTGDPLDKIAVYWPQIVAAMKQEGIYDHATEIAVIATCAVEMDFEYLTELSDGTAYNGRLDLGNTEPGDGPRFVGRGFTQITGRANYRTYGQRLGLDLEGNPELAADPHVAALVMCLYFQDRGIPTMARAGNWWGVRYAVNGGYTAIGRFLNIVADLENTQERSDAPIAIKVAVTGALKQQPNNTCPAAVGPDGKPVKPPVGTVVVFTADPRTKQEVTPHYAHISLPGSPAHGWYLRGYLAEVQ